MNQTIIDKVVAAVLYEGYILYPYRPSVKNRQRWTFGGLYPQGYCVGQQSGDFWSMQTECLVLGSLASVLEITVRFLHLVDRTVGELSRPLVEVPAGAEPLFRIVETLQVGDRCFQSWQEAVERKITLGAISLKELAKQPLRQSFAFAGSRNLELVRSPSGEVAGVLVRQQQPIAGYVELTAAAGGHGLFKLTVRIVNQTSEEDPGGMSRDEALLRSLVSTHTLLGVHGGEFVSLMDPPESCRAAVADCRNIGAWPVLVGEEGQRDTMLSAPIILYDYPQVAPESPGDLFDCTEIDEILTLRIMTLTDEEKRQALAVDERTRALLERTEALAREQMMGLHGTVRGLRPLHGGK